MELIPKVEKVLKANTTPIVFNLRDVLKKLEGKKP